MDKFLLSLPSSSKCNKRKASTDLRMKCSTSIAFPVYQSNKKSSNQMFLDLGQKSFGKNKTCKNCNMFYVIGDVEDEKRHKKFCLKIISGHSLPNIRGLKVIKDILESNSKIIKLSGQQEINKVLSESLKLQIREDLGSTFEFIYELSSSCPSNFVIYAFIYGHDKIIAGLLVVENISADTVVEVNKDTDLTSLDINNNNPNNTNENFPRVSAVVGIKLVWVHSLYRRKGLATTMLDAARQSFQYGTVISRQQLAFSQPTAEGLELASKYLRTTTRLRVYA